MTKTHSWHVKPPHDPWAEKRAQADAFLKKRLPSLPKPRRKSKKRMQPGTRAHFHLIMDKAKLRKLRPKQLRRAVVTDGTVQPIKGFATAKRCLKQWKGAEILRVPGGYVVSHTANFLLGRNASAAKGYAIKNTEGI